MNKLRLRLLFLEQNFSVQISITKCVFSFYSFIEYVFLGNIYERGKLVSGLFYNLIYFILLCVIEKRKKSNSNKHNSRPVVGNSGKRLFVGPI